MNNQEAITALLTRLKQPAQQSTEALTQIFNDYKTLVADYKSAGSEYQTALQHVHEEFSDLERLISRKHDVILKGRLTDAIRAFMKKVESLHPESQTDAQGATGDDPTFHRNKPSLNMD